MNKQQQLDQLYEEASQHLPLMPGAQRFVFGAGNADASLLFLGEAPGRYEDEKGIPFCGPAGKVLDQFFAKAGIVRDAVYITAVVKSRPPNNRKPTFEERSLYRPLLMQQIAYIHPKIICTLGSTALEALLNIKSVRVTDMRGKPFIFEEYTIVPTYHPAHFLYHKNQAALQQFEQDLAMAKKLACTA